MPASHRIVFAVVFSSIVIGVLVLDGFMVSAMRRAASMHAWPTTSGTIVEMHVENHSYMQRRGGQVARFNAEGRVEYEVNGRRYRADTATGKGEHAVAEAYVAAHQPGTVVTVYYNPADPADAVIELPMRRLGVPRTAVLVAANLVGLLTALGLVKLVRQWRRTNAGAASP